MLIAICDDQKAIADHTKKIMEAYLQTEKNIAIVTFYEPDKLLEFSKENSIQIIFMDIEMGEISGIDVVKQLLRIQPLCQVVYLTGYLNYALDVYETKHTYFLLKDELEKRLPDVMDKVYSKMEEKEQKLIVRQRDTEHVIPIEKIRYLETQGRTTYVHTDTGTIITGERLEGIYQRLPGKTFARCHKSYVISLDYVKSYERTRVYMDSEEEIPISRSYIKSVREKFFYWAGV